MFHLRPRAGTRSVARTEVSGAAMELYELMRRRLAIACAVSLLCAGTPAFAARYCVNTPLALAIALTQAQNNGEADDIELETGTYSLGGELQYYAVPGETFDLTLRGGAEPGTDCFVAATSGATVLDGQDAARPLMIYAFGRVNVSNITFESGHPTQYAGGALNISATIADVESNQFIANHAATGNSGSAVYISATLAAYFNSNLVIGNTGTSALYFYATNIADVNNNTIVTNLLDNHVGVGAFNPTGAGHYNLSNNIFWNNEGNDVFDQGGGTDYFHNDIGTIANMAPHSETGDFSTDPDFASGLLNFHLAADSPLVNAGLDSPLGGTGATDADGGTRLIGKHVDIGALESDVLFRDGFGP